MVMPVRLSVGCDVHQLRPRTRFGESSHEARGELLAIVEKLLESDCLRDRPVVEEQADLSAAGGFQQISACGINARPVNVLPVTAAKRTERFGLMRGKYRE